MTKTTAFIAVMLLVLTQVSCGTAQKLLPSPAERPRPEGQLSRSTSWPEQDTISWDWPGFSSPYSSDTDNNRLEDRRVAAPDTFDPDPNWARSLDDFRVDSVACAGHIIDPINDEEEGVVVCYRLYSLGQDVSTGEVQVFGIDPTTSLPRWSLPVQGNPGSLNTSSVWVGGELNLPVQEPPNKNAVPQWIYAASADGNLFVFEDTGSADSGNNGEQLHDFDLFEGMSDDVFGSPVMSPGVNSGDIVYTGFNDGGGYLFNMRIEPVLGPEAEPVDDESFYFPLNTIMEGGNTASTPVITNPDVELFPKKAALLLVSDFASSDPQGCVAVIGLDEADGNGGQPSFVSDSFDWDPTPGGTDRPLLNSVVEITHGPLGGDRALVTSDDALLSYSIESADLVENDPLVLKRSIEATADYKIVSQPVVQLYTIFNDPSYVYRYWVFFVEQSIDTPHSWHVRGVIYEEIGDVDDPPAEEWVSDDISGTCFTQPFLGGQGMGCDEDFGGELFVAGGDAVYGWRPYDKGAYDVDGSTTPSFESYAISTGGTNRSSISAPMVPPGYEPGDVRIYVGSDDCIVREFAPYGADPPDDEVTISGTVLEDTDDDGDGDDPLTTWDVIYTVNGGAEESAALTSGAYAITVPIGSDVHVFPEAAGYTFVPPHRDYEFLLEDAPDQDYVAYPLDDFTPSWPMWGFGVGNSRFTGDDGPYSGGMDDYTSASNSGAMSSAPVLSGDGLAFAPAANGNLYRFNWNGGGLDDDLWCDTGGGQSNVCSSAALDDFGVVYFCTANALYAVSQADGTLIDMELFSDTADPDEFGSSTEASPLVASGASTSVILVASGRRTSDNGCVVCGFHTDEEEPGELTLDYREETEDIPVGQPLLLPGGGATDPSAVINFRDAGGGTILRRFSTIDGDFMEDETMADSVVTGGSPVYTTYSSLMGTAIDILVVTADQLYFYGLTTTLSLHQSTPTARSFDSPAAVYVNPSTQVNTIYVHMTSSVFPYPSYLTGIRNTMGSWATFGRSSTLAVPGVGAPAIDADGYIYTAANGTLYVFPQFTSNTTFNASWSMGLSGLITASPTIGAGDSVYLPVNDGSNFELWTFRP